MSATPFFSTQAVETWDAWFRWREHGTLRDITIEDTWERVASTLATGSAAARRPGYMRRLNDAMQDWHLLLDERVLASAGTQAPAWRASDLAAVLNVASFVRAPGLPHASLDCTVLEEIAALAVFALDDAAQLVPDAGACHALRIGLIGLGDALHLLGLPYDSEAGRSQAQQAAAALTHGCLAGAIAIARDRAGGEPPSAAWLTQALARGHAPELIAAARRYGLRHASLTAITPQPRLACFANRVSDALDPVMDLRCAKPLCASGDSRKLGVNGYAASVAGRSSGVRACASVTAQLRMRAAVQAWIDEPIAYPLVAETAPNAAYEASWIAQAAELGLPPPRWRLAANIDCREGTTLQAATVV